VLDFAVAIVMPVIVISGAWVIAPSHKTFVSIAVFALGAAVVFFVFSPTLYPEYHPKKYQETYGPFYVAVSVGLLTLIVLLLRPWRRFS